MLWDGRIEQVLGTYAQALTPYQRKEEGRRHLEASKTLSRGSAAPSSYAASTTAASVLSDGPGASSGAGLRIYLHTLSHLGSVLTYTTISPQ